MLTVDQEGESAVDEKMCQRRINGYVRVDREDALD